MSPDDKVRYEQAVSRVKNIEEMLRYVDVEPAAICDREQLKRDYNQALDEMHELEKFAAFTGEDSV